MEGLDLPSCEAFQAWLAALRDDTRRWQVKLLRELVGRTADPHEALALACRWSALDPYDAIARTTLIELLERARRRQEAGQQRGAAIRALDEAEVATPSALRTRPAAAAAAHPFRTYQLAYKVLCQAEERWRGGGRERRLAPALKVCQTKMRLVSATL